MHHCRTACRARCHFLDIPVRFLATSWNANWIKVIQRQICTNASYVTAYHVSKGRLIAQTWLQLLLPMALLFLKQTLEKFCELFEWRFHYVFWEFGNKIQSCSKNNKNKNIRPFLFLKEHLWKRFCVWNGQTSSAPRTFFWTKILIIGVNIL